MTGKHFAFLFILAFALGSSSLCLAGSDGGARIALYRGSGAAGAGPGELTKEFSESLKAVTPADIRGGALTNFDVVIFPGGSGNKEAAALGEAGRDAVQSFVANGGGYVGICAGAYLATSDYPWSLKLIKARTLSSHWACGKAVVKVDLTDSGREILGGQTNLTVLYHNGPIVGPSDSTNLAPYEALAVFREEVVSNKTPKGIMLGAPAIFAGQYHRGKVICLSPHFEQTPGDDYIIRQAVKWATPTQKEVAR